METNTLQTNASLASKQFRFHNPFQEPYGGSVTGEFYGGSITWKCMCEPTITFNDIQRLTKFLGTTDISITTRVDRDCNKENWSLIINFKIMEDD